jgi:glucose/mannose-6-phosphate isomerase
VLDSLGMLAAALSLPEQVAAAHARVAQQAERLDALRGPTAVHLVVDGDASVAADVLAALVAATSRVPITIGGDDALPGHVGPGTLVVALSTLGDNLAAPVASAAAAGASVVELVAGPQPASGAPTPGVVHLALGGDAPAPRTASAALAVAALTVLEHVGAGQVDGAGVGVGTQVDQAVAALGLRRDEHGGPDDLPRSIAHRIGRTMPLVYGAGPLGAVATRHWKARINQDAKAPAFAHHVPALLHDELSGWGQHGDVTRQVFTLVLLRHDHEQPHHEAALDAVAEVCQEVVAGVHPVVARGDGPLAQLLDLCLVGDLTALHLAAEAGVDPGPVPAVQDVARLAGPG